MSNPTRRTLRSRTSSASSPAATSPPPSSMATTNTIPRGRQRDPALASSRTGLPTPPSVGNDSEQPETATPSSGSRFAPLQEEAREPTPSTENADHSAPPVHNSETGVESTLTPHDEALAGVQEDAPPVGQLGQDAQPNALPPPPEPPLTPRAQVAEVVADPSPMRPVDPTYRANPTAAWDGLLSSMSAEPAHATPTMPTREEVMHAASSGDIDHLMRLIERYASGNVAATQPPSLPTAAGTSGADATTTLPPDRGTKRAATPSGPTQNEGSPKRNRPDSPSGDDLADLYDDLDSPSANTTTGRDNFARIMRSVHDRDPDAAAQQLGSNMQALHYGLDLLDREDARGSTDQPAAREHTPAIAPMAQALGAGPAHTQTLPASAATTTPTTEPTHQGHTGIRVVTAGSTPGPHPFPAGVTIRTVTRGVSTACVTRWLKNRGIPFFGSQMNPHNGPANTNAAAKAIRAHFPDLEFAIWTASYDLDSVPPPPNVAAYFMRTDNEEAIERLAEEVHIIRPHVNLTFVPIDRGLHPGETWFTNIDGLGLPVMDSWIKQDLREAIQEVLLDDDVFRAMIIANRGNIPDEIANEDAPAYVVRTIRVVPLRLALPGGTSFNYAIRIFGLPPTLDVSAFQQLQAHLYTMTYTTPYGVGYAHLFDVCGVCTAMDHPRGLCSLPSIPGYLGPLPGRELNPAAVASEALVDPAQAIGHAHLIGIRTAAADDQPAANPLGQQQPPPMGGQSQNGMRGARGGRGGFPRGRGGARGNARGRGRGRGGNFIF
ncbi:hypothetical protein GGG16DRAFT_104711 [Schizophyllum commune]